MLGIFLNIGAGSKLMGTRAFGQFAGEEHDYVIFNMDSGHEKVSKLLQGKGWTANAIKTAFGERQLNQIIAEELDDAERNELGAHAKSLSASDNNFEYSPADCIMLQDLTVEMIFAISPYGYKPLNKETHRVLKREGIVVVAGTSNNPFYKVPHEQADAELFTELAVFPPVVKRVIEKVGSQTTHGADISSRLEYKAFMKN